MREFSSIASIMSGRENPLEFETPERTNNREGIPSDGKIRHRKSLIESETQDRREAPGGKPERVSTKEASVP
jgi:hypothetical protein